MTSLSNNWQTSWINNAAWLIDLIDELGDTATDYITEIRLLADQLLEGDTTLAEVEEFADTHGVHNLMFLQDYKTAVDELSEDIVSEFLEDFGMDPAAALAVAIRIHWSLHHFTASRILRSLSLGG